MSIPYSLLLKTSTVKNISISLVASQLVFLLMMIYTLPVINKQIGTKVFDLQTFGYSLTTAESIVNNLNEQTTNLYLFPQLTLLDLLYPFLLGLFLSSLLFRLIKLTDTRSKTSAFVLTAPFLMMTFDYSENVCIILMLTKSVDISETIVFLSSTFTILKGLLTSVAWIAILVYAIKWVRMKAQEKSNK